jgi:hypothetical protein
MLHCHPAVKNEFKAARMTMSKLGINFFLPCARKKERKKRPLLRPE